MFSLDSPLTAVPTKDVKSCSVALHLKKVCDKFLGAKTPIFNRYSLMAFQWA